MKTKCDICKKEQRRRFMKRFKGKLLCSNCFNGASTLMPVGNLGPRYTDEEVQNKIRNVYSKQGSNGRMVIMVSLPQNYIGKKVKVKIVEVKNGKNS